MKTQVSRRRVQTSQYLLIFRGFKRLTAIIAFTLTLGLSHTAIAGTVIAVLGDSLAAGFGLATNEGFPARLEAALRNAGEDVRVINAGVSGDTSAGGLARLDWVLGDQPDIVLVELGSNDALRGLDPEETFDNLDSIVLNLRAREVTVILAGMMAPRNLGREYVNAFDAIYRRVAEKHRIALYPFFLYGVALNPAFNQADLIHPNQAGVDIIVEKILPAMHAVLQDHRGVN
jgi:acyl-CoA thioesterase-1